MAKQLVGNPSDWYYLLWMDSGTGRIRLSWHPDKDTLVRRAAKLYHPDMEPALYAGLGERVPMPAAVKGARKKSKKRKAVQMAAESVAT